MVEGNTRRKTDKRGRVVSEEDLRLYESQKGVIKNEIH
jgi:hypothetical protein